MPPKRTAEQIAEEKRKIDENTKAAIAKLKETRAKKKANLEIALRRVTAVDARAQRKRDDHAKILIGVASIQLGHESTTAHTRLKDMLGKFYADSPVRLEAALAGLNIRVTKPATDADSL